MSENRSEAKVHENLTLALFILGWILIVFSSAPWSRALGAVAFGSAFSMCAFIAWKRGLIKTNGNTVCREENPTRFRIYLILWILFSLGFSIALIMNALG